MTEHEARARRQTRGRDAAASDIIDAAARLYARKGPTAVSLREVAAAADVNIGLIHHYIGNKDDLITAVLERGPDRDYVTMTDDELVDAMTDLLVSSDPDAPDMSRSMINIRAALAGIDLTEHRSEFPVLETIYARISRHCTPDVARVRAAYVMATLAGWLVMGPNMLTALGAKDLDREVIKSSLTAAFKRTMADENAP